MAGIVAAPPAPCQWVGSANRMPEVAEVNVSPLKVARIKLRKAEVVTEKKPTRDGCPRSTSVSSRVIGKAVALPPDLSVHHDPYLYGLPKRQNERGNRRRGSKRQ